jgi:hypothetical protein
MGRIDLTAFVVCATCQTPFELSPQRGFPTPQRCSCERRRAGDPRWPGYDFNEHLHLCECCRMEPLPSGSRWSVWFCTACKDRVVELNTTVGRVVVPIGRHSLLSGVGIEGRRYRRAGRRKRRALLESFGAGVDDLSSGMDRLHALARERSVELRGGLGLSEHDEVSLQEWLTRLQAARASHTSTFGKEASFERLMRALTAMEAG